MSTHLKRWLINSRIPSSNLIEHINGLLKYGKFWRDNPSPVYFDYREDMYDYVHDLISHNSYDFLEFGVCEGTSIKYWTGLSSNMENRYFGFDTFTGLPETWDTGLSTDPKGSYSVGGNLPKLDDDRISFVKGLFQDTLTDFLKDFEPQPQLVVHLDADLYSADLFVLTTLHPLLVKDTHVLFDNFCVSTHDFRAFMDYVSAYNRKFEVIATSDLHFGRTAIKLL